ncbi:MAG: efflux RND transporter permease subunit [Methylococcales bacterium]
MNLPENPHPDRDSPESRPQAHRQGDQPKHSGLIAWFACNPVAANLLMILIAVGGIGSFWQLRKEVMPRIDPHQIELRAVYPGAGPEEIETSLCIPIEEAIHSLAGIKRLNSEAVEGECRVDILVHPDRDLAGLMSSLRPRIQEIRNLPKELEKIEIQEKTDAWEAINVMLYGSTDALTLRRLGQRVRDDLVRIPGVARLLDYNDALSYEVTIQIAAEQLRRYRMTLGEVAEAVRNASLDLPGGSLKTVSGDLLVRAKGRAEEATDFARLILRTNPDGSRIRLGDVALIRDGLVETPFEDRFDGVSTEGWEVFAERDAVDVARRVKDYVEEARKRLPEGIRLSTWWDNSIMFEERLQTLLEDGIAGFALVFLVLMLFLRAQVAFWAAAGILTSLLGALWMMPVLGLSLNMVSLFGFLLAMGILVDDAIIVGERVHTFQSQGLPGIDGAIRGVKEVALPVTLAVLTTLVAFLPGLTLPGWAGQMMVPICMVMILTVLFSLIEALLILPAHLAPLPHPDQRKSLIQPLRIRLNRALDSFVCKLYRPFLGRAFRWKYLTVAVFLVFMLLTALLPMTGFVRVSLQADITKDYFRVELSLPPGAPFSENRALAERVERALFSLRDDLDRDRPPGGPSVISHLESLILERNVYFYVEFSPNARQKFAIDDLVRDWRRRIGAIGRAKIDFLYKQGESPYDIVIDLSAKDAEVLNDSAEALKKQLASYPGVYDLSDSYEPGKPEVRLKLKSEAERLGLRLKDVAETVRRGFYGEEVQRFQREGEQIKVFVRLPLTERTSLEHLLAMPIRLPGGDLAPLGHLADVNFAPGYSKLIRQDRRRMLQVQARIDKHLADVNAIYADLEQGIMKSLRQNRPALRMEVGQERQEQENMAEVLGRNALIALVVIYALIAVPFRSYLKPVIFLLAAPVAWSGAVLAHRLTGLPLSMESLVGMIAASGVVVNDSLVLLDYLQEKGQSDMPIPELIEAACTARFRPIFLAFLTNFAGFLPTMLETSAQAQFLIPMTLSLSAGLLFGMMASLVLTPVCYGILAKS